MELTYEEYLHKELVLLITTKLLDHGIEDGKVVVTGSTKISPNPFIAFINVNVGQLADCIVEGEVTWGEFSYIKEENS